MAEFAEVMKKRKEMHEYYLNERNCKKCPLGIANNGHVGMGCDEFVYKYPEEAEQKIMSWTKPVDWSKVPVDTKVLLHSWQTENMSVEEIKDLLNSEHTLEDVSVEQSKKCTAYEDGCEEWAGCPCMNYKAE